MNVCIPFLLGMTFHSQSMNRNKKRQWPSHFLKRFNIQHKAKINLESDSSYHLLKKALKKSANDSLRDVFIQWMYTHTQTHTHTLATRTQRFSITFWKGKTGKNA